HHSAALSRGMELHHTPKDRGEVVNVIYFHSLNEQWIPVTMPNMDLTVTEARVVAWLKHEGDAVRQSEPLLEVETDKAVVSIETPASGRLARVLAPVGSVVKLTECVGEIDPVGMCDTAGSR
ncbi:MAG: lipoyl domain-containing protein, partial [Candidatus Omnitrophica bacterium]|nr:lipoyl domain-containing protein [Candidatus Omnitrophota bacterium]